MMKKLILFFAIFLSLGNVFANEYPQKLNNSQKLITAEEFRGIYQRIYEDSNNEDLVEICKRTLRWPEFWKVNTKGDKVLIYSISNCTNLREKNTLTEFINLEEKNNQSFNIISKNFEIRFNQELDLLKMENDLRRETGFAYIFADGAEDQNNSPFDLVSDLNEIDEVFFGEKHTRPEFEFIPTAEQVITHEIPTEDSDVWLEQTLENLAAEQDEFNNPLNSFAGSFWSLGVKNFREKLNVHDLATEHTPKTAIDTPYLEGMSTSSGSTADTHQVPIESNDEPESKKLSYNPLPKLDSLIYNYLLKQSNYKDLKNYNYSRRNDLNKISSDIEYERILIQEKLSEFRKENSRESENASFRKKIDVFSHLTSIIDLFREKMTILRKDIIPNFLKKPQHSS